MRAALGGVGLALCALAACTSTVGPREAAPLALSIAHINDHHAQLEPFAGTELRLDGVPTQVELGGFARLTTLFRQAEASRRHLLKLHAGDALTGTLYYTLFKGEVDAKLMNTVCFDAFELGNHEFDDGDASLQRFLQWLGQGSCPRPTAVLAANVQPAAGTPLDGVLSPYMIRHFDGIPVGVIGIDIVGKTVNSSRPLPSTRFLDEILTAQTHIDALRARGVRHIVLLTHQGHAADVAMAARLSGVDVIIGGDSHSLLGNFEALGVASAGPYPTQVHNREGDTVCIAQAWEYSKAFGLLDVRFDGQGRVQQCSGQAALVVGGPFKRKDASGRFLALEPAAQAALEARLSDQPGLALARPDPAAAAMLAGYAGQVDAQKARVIGRALEPLCLVRVPGEATNRSAGVPGCEEAHRLARGSDVAQVVAQAFLAASPRAQFALQNAGGVRVPVPTGPVSMNTAFTVLPFSNVLVEMDLSGDEVLAALEDGVANHLDAGQSDGSHPYAAGLRWHLDMRQPRGQRFSQVEVKDRKTGSWAPLQGQAVYLMVTNDFIAAGKDGYATLGAAHAQGRALNTYRLYTQTLVDAIVARPELRRPPAEELSHQAVSTREGLSLP